MSVRPSVCPVGRLPLAAAWARAADRSAAVGVRLAAAGSVMLRTEVRGSTRTCYYRQRMTELVVHMNHSCEVRRLNLKLKKFEKFDIHIQSHMIPEDTQNSKNVTMFSARMLIDLRSPTNRAWATASDVTFF